MPAHNDVETPFSPTGRSNAYVVRRIAWWPSERVEQKNRIAGDAGHDRDVAASELPPRMEHPKRD